MEIFLNLCKGYLLALLYVLADVTSFSSVQALQGVIPDLELSAIRLFLQCLILYFVSKWNDDISFPMFPDYKWMVAAVIGYFLLNFGLFGSAKCLPLAFHGSLFQLVSFLVMAFLLRLFQSEPTGVVNVLAMLICLVGIILTSQPAFLFSSKLNDDFPPKDKNSTCHNDDEPHELEGNPYCYFLLVTGSAGTALCFFILGYKLKYMNMFTRIFWMSLGSLYVTILASFYLEPINVSFIVDFNQVVLVLITRYLLVWR